MTLTSKRLNKDSILVFIICIVLFLPVRLFSSESPAGSVTALSASRDKSRIKQLEEKNAELREENGVLKAMLRQANSGTIDINKKIRAIKSEYGVQVHYKYDKKLYFSAGWIRKPSSAEGKQILEKEVERILPIIETFLSRSPKKVIKRNLSDIFLLGELTFYGKSFGATASLDGLYIKSKGVEKGYTKEFLLESLFHEFSSILFRNYDFPKTHWESINPKNFKYSGTGVEVLGSANLYDQTDELLREGFLVKYSQSSLENDLNMLSEWLFTKGRELDVICKKNHRVKLKKEIAQKFYKKIDREYKFN